MNDTLIVTVYVILDDLLRAMEHRTDRRGWIGAGAMCALAAAWRLDFGVYVVIAACATAFVASAPIRFNSLHVW